MRFLYIGLLLCFLSFLVAACAPLPKEEDSSKKAEITLTFQHLSSERSTRAGSSSRSTEFIVVVANGSTFSQKGPSTHHGYRVLDLSSNQISLSLDLDIPLQLFIYRYADTYNISQLQNKLANQTLDQGAIDFGVTELFSISSSPSTNPALPSNYNAKLSSLTLRLKD